MGDRLNPEAELERLAAMHEKIARLRDQIKRLKEKEARAEQPPTESQTHSAGKAQDSKD